MFVYLQWIGYTSQILPWNELDLRLQAALSRSAEGKTVVLILKEAVKRHILNVFIPLSFSAVSPKCVHNGKEFSEGEVYRMDPCWLCQCRGGISFCSKAECAELDCENFYIPEGECCPVCIGTHTHTPTVYLQLSTEMWTLAQLLILVNIVKPPARLKADAAEEEVI